MPYFIPPYPPRQAKWPSIIKTVWRGRKNLLSIWPEVAFKYDTMHLKLLHKTVVICNSPETVRHALVTHNATFERKSHLVRIALKPLIGDSLFISDGALWEERRRIVGSIIHSSRLAQFEHSMVSTLNETRDALQSKISQPIDMLACMAQLTAKIICRTAFGQQLDTQSADQLVKGFANYQENVGVFNLMPLLGLPQFVAHALKFRMWSSAKSITQLLDKIIANTQIQNDEQNTSFVSSLLSARNKEGKALLDSKAVRNEVAVIFLAGQETTANCLAWVWYLLSQSPEVEARMHAEIDRVLEGRIPTLEDLPQLIYTRAVIDETLRLYPPVPILTREAMEDTSIRRRFVAKGSLICVVPWLLHRHQKYWDKPDHFNPERFLPDAKPIEKFAYIPFSVGPRVCAGRAYGLTEATLTLAMLAQRYTFELVPGTQVEAISRLTLRPGESLPMIVRNR